MIKLPFKITSLRNSPVIFFFLVFWLLARPGAVLAGAEVADWLNLAGVVKNSQGQGIQGVRVEILINGQPLASETQEFLFTDKKGGFSTRLFLPAGVLPKAQVKLKAEKTAWKSAIVPVKVLTQDYDGQGQAIYQALVRLNLERQVTTALGLATIILAGVLLIISLNWVHRALAALLGAALMLFISYTLGNYKPTFFIISFEEAIAAIDMNVILLLLGMMIIVGVTKKTGVFQWLAYKAFALSRGRVFILVIILMWVTAVSSAFLDNVTMMLLLVPVTIEIAVALKLNPFSLLLPEVFASSLGGAATLIGDPPNILIGSYANLTFGVFVTHLAPICVICLVVSSIYFIYWYKEDYRRAEVVNVAAALKVFRQEYRLTNGRLLVMCLTLLSFTVFLFAIHGFLHMKPSVAALMGAMLLVAVSRVDIVDILENEVEWPTLIFFMALFIVVAGVEATGLIHFIAEWMGQISQGNMTLALLIVLWASAITSAFLDTVLFTATMLPIIAFLNTTIPEAAGGMLWWALALGACLGGNGTMTGASANLVTVGLAARAGYQLSFPGYLKICFLPMLITISLCSIYLMIFR